MFRPIYPPRPRAREYCDLGVNMPAGADCRGARVEESGGINIKGE